MLGVHWIADVVGCAPEQLRVDPLRSLLRELPDRLGLTRIGEPQLFEHRPEREPATIAGIVLIAESHVSVHCFPTEHAVHVDVFSCKQMDLVVARAYVLDFFRAHEVVEKVLERGSRAGKDSLPRAQMRRAR